MEILENKVLIILLSVFEPKPLGSITSPISLYLLSSKVISKLERTPVTRTLTTSAVPIPEYP